MLLHEKASTALIETGNVAPAGRHMHACVVHLSPVASTHGRLCLSPAWHPWSAWSRRDFCRIALTDFGRQGHPRGWGMPPDNAPPGLCPNCPSSRRVEQSHGNTALLGRVESAGHERQSSWRKTPNSFAVIVAAFRQREGWADPVFCKGFFTQGTSASNPASQRKQLLTCSVCQLTKEAFNFHLRKTEFVAENGILNENSHLLWRSRNQAPNGPGWTRPLLSIPLLVTTPISGQDVAPQKFYPHWCVNPSNLWPPWMWSFHWYVTPHTPQMSPPSQQCTTGAKYLALMAKSLVVMFGKVQVLRAQRVTATNSSFLFLFLLDLRDMVFRKHALCERFWSFWLSVRPSGWLAQMSATAVNFRNSLCVTWNCIWQEFVSRRCKWTWIFYSLFIRGQFCIYVQLKTKLWGKSWDCRKQLRDLEKREMVCSLTYIQAFMSLYLQGKNVSHAAALVVHGKTFFPSKRTKIRQHALLFKKKCQKVLCRSVNQSFFFFRKKRHISLKASSAQKAKVSFPLRKGLWEKSMFSILSGQQEACELQLDTLICVFCRWSRCLPWGAANKGCVATQSHQIQQSADWLKDKSLQIHRLRCNCVFHRSG